MLTKMKAAVEAFFALPLVEKQKYAMAANDLQGYGQGYVVSDQQKLDWNDLMFLMTLPTKYRNFKYWPTTIPGFKYEFKNLLKARENRFLIISKLMLKVESEVKKHQTLCRAFKTRKNINNSKRTATSTLFYCS